MTTLEVLHGVRSEDRQSFRIAMLVSKGGLNVAVVRDTDPLSKVKFRVTFQAPRELFRVERVVDPREELESEFLYRRL